MPVLPQSDPAVSIQGKMQAAAEAADQVIPSAAKATGPSPKQVAQRVAPQVLHQPAALDPETTVLLNVAMCDTLQCSAGYKLRPDAYKTVCGGPPGSMTCALDVDSSRCCQMKVDWYAYLFA